jgi:hypothetical protein
VSRIPCFDFVGASGDTHTHTPLNKRNTIRGYGKQTHTSLNTHFPLISLSQLSNTSLSSRGVNHSVNGTAPSPLAPTSCHPQSRTSEHLRDDQMGATHSLNYSSCCSCIDDRYRDATPTRLLAKSPSPKPVDHGTYDPAKGCISAPTTPGYNGHGLPYGTSTGSAAPAAASTRIGVATVPLSTKPVVQTHVGELTRAIAQHRQDKAHYDDALQRLTDIENRLRIGTPKEEIAELQTQRLKLKTQVAHLQSIVEEGHVKVTGLTALVGEERDRGVALFTLRRSNVDPGARRSTSPDHARTTSHRGTSPEPGGKGRAKSTSPEANPRRGSGSPSAKRLQQMGLCA